MRPAHATRIHRKILGGDVLDEQKPILGLELQVDVSPAARIVVNSYRNRNAVALRQRCAKLLSPHKIPRRFIFLDRLPVDARGKMDRRALEALATAEPGAGGVRL